MKGKAHFLSVVISLILTSLFLIPALGQAKEEDEARYKAQNDQMVKELKLAPEKEKAILAVEDKYTKERKEIMAGVRKANDDLQAALSAANPGEAKLKELVGALTSSQDKMFTSFKKQRDEELALMTPAEQAKYLIVQGQWREKMMEKRSQKAAGEKK
jgi:Spy/CpxP family protein refolding chaperone